MRRRDTGGREGGGNPPPGTPGDPDLLGRAVDRDVLLDVFQRVLPTLSDVPLRIESCRAKVVESRRALREGRRRIVYSLRIAAEGIGPREFLLLGSTPVPPTFLSRELIEQSEAVQGHPAVAPFQRFVAYVEELRMVVQLFPVDLGLPGLADVTGPRGAELFAPHLPECRAGATIERLEWDVPHPRHYKPGNRCVMKFMAGGDLTSGAPFERGLFVKIFSDERGAESFRRMEDLWRVASGSPHLHVPEPLGYDPGVRMLVMAEAPGEKEMGSWVKCLEKERPLPAGVDLDRIERYLGAAAAALAELQRTRLEPPVQRRFRDELSHLRRERDLLSEARPRLAGPVSQALERLETHALDGEVLVPSHGAFRPTQIVSRDQHLTIFDWDGFCLANAAADAASFLVRLRQGGIRRPGIADVMERLATTFRREFLRRCPDVRPGEVALYEALRLLDRALRSLRGAQPMQDVTRESTPLVAAGMRMVDLYEEEARDPA